jgi:hypothetical protein
MLMNNAVSVTVGLIPIAGDVVLAVFKANSRNAALLEEFLRIRGEEFIKLENKKKADGGMNEVYKKIQGKKGTNNLFEDDNYLLICLPRIKMINRHPSPISSRLNQVRAKIPNKA